MMTVSTINFVGTLHPATPAPYSVHCITCGALLTQGENAVDVATIQHDCTDTSSQQREYEITWTSPIPEVTDGTLELEP